MNVVCSYYKTSRWQLVTAWRRGILNTWHKNGSRRYRGSRLTNLIGKSVTFSVKMTYGSSATAHWQAVKNGAQNAVKVMPYGFTSYVEGIGGWRGYGKRGQYPFCYFISRYSTKPPKLDPGQYFSYESVSFPERALLEKTTLYRYRVLKSMSYVKSGKALPWFDQPGGGLQFESELSIQELIKQGYIKPIL